MAERTEHPRTRRVSDPDPAVAKILAGVRHARRAVCVFCGSATLPHGLESHAEACEGGGAARKARGPLMRGGPARAAAVAAVEEDLLDTDSVKAHRAALNAYNRLCGRIYVEASRRARPRSAASAVAGSSTPRDPGEA